MEERFQTRTDTSLLREVVPDCDMHVMSAEQIWLMAGLAMLAQPDGN